MESNKISKINELYKNPNKQSLSEILESFSCISKNYNKIEIAETNYSNVLYNLCTEDEQQRFFNDQLQLIECLVTNTIYDKVGTIWNWKDIYDLTYDEEYKSFDKIKRHVIYPTSHNNRPIGEVSFQMWNGLQIIDLDIKNVDIANGLKDDLFNDLSQYHWFLGITKSASKKSLHIWTKIIPISVEYKNRRIEYMCNFRHKYSYVYMILSKYTTKYNYTKENIYEYIDMAMAKPQQGIFIPSDNAYLSTNFQDLRLDVNFESAFNTGIESIDWISHPDLKRIFSKLEWFTNDNFIEKQNIEIANIENINDYDINKSKGRKHYKHFHRWQLANTLTALFGEQKAFTIMCHICKDTSARELKGDVKTAAIHSKPISQWAVNELNNFHGFNIKLKTNEDDSKLNELELEINNAETTIDPIKILNDKTNQTMLYITKDQYLSDIKDDIIKNLDHITLLEAGAGYGKTEMIKSLKSKTLLILPFTSTIKSKVEVSEVTKDWLYFYGNKKPTLSDILGTQNMSMTIDKFSRLNVYELDTANFEYIVIDESHLLFTSSYRDVMGPCIQRLANCKAKVIMMTGTPTGEMLFFPNIKHIKVKKEDIRIKECSINLVPSPTEQLYEMCKDIAIEIVQNNKKVLFPTNNGILYYEQVLGVINQILNDADPKSDLHKAWLARGKKIKSFYYKKSKYGEEGMDNINVKKTLGDNDLVLCTTFLSVGVDICDTNEKFVVYFNETMIPQDIEQFTNRIRNNDLYIKMYLPLSDNTGTHIDYTYVHPLNLEFNQQDLMVARDLVKTCNDMLERNEEESKYNPLISSLLSTNKYLKYDENDCKYYIDETTYKLKVFEDRYSDYSKQLNVMVEGIKYYGYDVKIKTSDQKVQEDNKERIEELIKSCRNIKYNEDTIKIKKLLDHITDGNIDQYRELLKGNYAIFKDKDDINEKIRNENNLYCEDIEILEKHIPIILSLYKHYDCDVIKEIYEYCIDFKSNRLNFSKLKRINQFVKIESSRKKKRLDFPVLRFIADCKKWVAEHTSTTKIEIHMFLAEWSCKYCNSIKDVVVDDLEYAQIIFDLVQQYWSIIITESRPKNGQITIKPFELLWKTKQQLNDIYGNWNTQTFFLEQLINETKEDENNDDEDDLDNIDDFEHTSKVKLQEIINELPSIVHKEFDYFDYSEKDKSNERFMNKQKNTNHLKDDIFVSNDLDEDAKSNGKNSQLDLFSNL